MVGAPDFKSGDPEFNSRSDHQRDFLEVVPCSIPPQRLIIANWSAYCQWDSLPVKFISVVCFIGPEKPQQGEVIYSSASPVRYICSHVPRSV